MAEVFLFFLFACDNKKNESGKNQKQCIDSSQKEISGKSESENISGTQRTVDGIDVDLTTLSGTMVYAEVYDMMFSPEKYIGKKIKMRGQFAYYEDTETENIYFACIISDATACCSQGIEFVLAEKRNFPADYPSEGTEITVSGTFETYEEYGNRYCRLANATLENQK